MKLSRYALNVILGITLSANVYAKDEINVNFKDLEIQDLIKITSKIIDKNIRRATSGEIIDLLTK